MFHPILKGKYYDMGYKYGALLYKHGFRVDEQPDEKLEFGRRSEAEVKRVFPEILEEIRGFAEGCRTSYEQMAAFMMGIGAFKFSPTCSVFAASNGSDVVFGRNYDFFYSLKKVTESYLTCPENGYCSLGHTDVFIGREDGVNEKGLAVGMTGVEGKMVKPGISFVLLLRGVLDKCANVKESVKMLSDAHVCSAFNFLLADREGDLAVVEASPDRIRARRPKKDECFMVCTNHFLHPEMQEMENLEERSKSNWDSLPRYTTIREAITQRDGKISVKDAQKILANHSGYVCSHQQKIKLGTIWSVVATLKQPQISRAEGHPCRTKYKQDLRLNKAVQKLQKN
jgi:predicted choloylglycine hydrolase